MSSILGAETRVHSLHETTSFQLHTPTSVTIETPRLELTDFFAGDYEDFYGLFHNLKNAGQEWFNVDVDRPETVDGFFTKILANQIETPRHTYRLAVRLKSSDGSSYLIGYVSLCNVFASDDARPDTGILINPLYQAHGYGREARLALGYFGFHGLGLQKLVCDVRHDNDPSLSNVLGMGYRQIFNEDKTPVIIPTTTVKGVQDWYRFHLTASEFDGMLPYLLRQQAERYWPTDLYNHDAGDVPFIIHNHPEPERPQKIMRAGSSNRQELAQR